MTSGTEEKRGKKTQSIGESVRPMIRVHSGKGWLSKGVLEKRVRGVKELKTAI